MGVGVRSNNLSVCCSVPQMKTLEVTWYVQNLSAVSLGTPENSAIQKLSILLLLLLLTVH